MKKRSKLLGICGALGMFVTGYEADIYGMDIQHMSEEEIAALSPRSRELVWSRFSLSWREEEEFDATSKAYKDARKESDPEKACKLFKIAICGTGESEFSKKYTEIVNENIKKFSESKESIPKVLDSFKKFLGEKDFGLIYGIPIIGCFSELGKELLNLAEQKISEGEREEALRLKNESVFWLYFGNFDKQTAMDLKALEEASHE